MNKDHLVIRGEILHCLHCQGTYKLMLPLDIRTFGKKTKAFIKLHEDCLERPVIAKASHE